VLISKLKPPQPNNNSIPSNRKQSKHFALDSLNHPTKALNEKPPITKSQLKLKIKDKLDALKKKQFRHTCHKI
jgi:hypothetical protein